MKNFEELMGDNDFRNSKGEKITEEEMATRARVFINAVESSDKEQRIFMSRLSLKLNNLFKAGCNSKQLIQAFNLEVRELWKKIK